MDDQTEFPLDSDQTMDNRTDKKSTIRNVHGALHKDNSITDKHTDQSEIFHSSEPPQTGIEETPNTPWQNPVQGTSTHRHDSDQHTPIPTSEHRTVHTHGQGFDPTRSLRDESTQMPSQEALMITSSQGTQFPSQQWEQTLKSKDQEERQHETHTTERAVKNTSFQRRRVSGTYTSSPTIPSHAKTHTADAVKPIILADSRPAGTRDNKTPDTKGSTDPRTVEPNYPRNDNSKSDYTTDLNVHNEDHTTSTPITIYPQPESVDTRGYPRTNSPLTHESRHTTQVDHGYTNPEDTEHPTVTYTKMTESQIIDNTIIEANSKENTPLQRLCSGQDAAGTQEPESTKGTHTPTTKVTGEISSEITPITITISASSSDDEAQVSAAHLQENRPDQDPQEITLSSSGDSSEESGNTNKQEITISSSENESTDGSHDTVTISSGDGSDREDAKTQSQNQQRNRQDQEVTIIGTTMNRRHSSTPRQHRKIHQEGQSSHIGPDHNNNISIQRRQKTSHHTNKDRPAITRNSCDGTLHRLIPIGHSDHPGHQVGPCYTHPKRGTDTPTDWDDDNQWSLIQTADYQGVNNFNQTPNGRLTTTSLGYPECNYCKLPSHSRQRCTFRLRDLENDIDRHQHPKKGFLTKRDARQYKPPMKRNRSPMSVRLARETDSTGNPKFWQTQSGHMVYSMNNQPQCYYCGVPFHGRDTCPLRREDESKGVFQTYNPLRGMLYTTLDLTDPDQPDQQIGDRQETADHNTYSEPGTSTPRNDETPTPPHQGTRESKDYKTKPKGEKTTRKRKHPDRAPSQDNEVTILDNEEGNKENTLTGGQQYQGTTQQSQMTTSTNLMDVPNEIMLTIMRYLSFEDNMKLRRVNKRMWQMAGMTSIWKDITILNRPLTCSLISHAISKQTTVLNIRYCSIQGNHTKMLNLGRKLRDGFSKLTFLGLQGFKGNDILAAIIAAESEDLEVLDLSENRYTLVGTVIGRMKENNKLKAINLSAIGGHYAEMGGLIYHPFDIHRMKPLVDKCRHLTDVILFGAKLTHEAITYFCENAPSTLLRLNLARERAYNDDIRALTRSCPHLQYLNIAETSVAYQDIINIVLTWKRTMINLCLPHRLGFILTLRSRTPNLPLIRQFQALMNEMEHLEYLHVGHYKFHQVDIEQRNPQVAKLRLMFPNLKINHNPYSTCPHTGGGNIPQSDPSFQFKRNIGPNSWASRRDAESVQILDLN